MKDFIVVVSEKQFIEVNVSANNEKEAAELAVSSNNRWEVERVRPLASTLSEWHIDNVERIDNHVLDLEIVSEEYFAKDNGRSHRIIELKTEDRPYILFDETEGRKYLLRTNSYDEVKQYGEKIV